MKIAKKSVLVILAAVLLSILTTFVALQTISARAEQVTVTVTSDGNGNVSAQEQNNQQQITVTADAGSVVELTASPTDGYVFAYWYENADTPLSYEAEYSYTIPAAPTTLHAKFFEKNDEAAPKVTFDNNYCTESDTVAEQAGDKTYTAQTSKFLSGSYESPAVVLEFTGDKYFTLYF